MGKSKKNKPKKFKPKLMIIAIIAFLAVVFVLGYINSLSKNFIMTLYIKTPSGSVIKVQECQGGDKDFECISDYHDCSEQGQYYGRALTLTGNIILSDSGWKPSYAC